MGSSRSIRKLLSGSVTAVFIGLGVVAANAQAALITWTLDGVSPFEFGESARGWATLDQTTIQTAPLGPTPVARWHIEITGGTNPQIPTIAFNDTDSGCLVACARLFKDSFDVSSINFRTPLATDNTYYEFVLGIEAGVNALIFPTSEEQTVLSTSMYEASTNIQYNQYHPSENFVSSITGSNLTSDGRVFVTAAIPEPATVELLVVGLAVMSFLRRLRKSGV